MTIKAICTAAVLSLCLAASAFAGEIGSAGSPKPGSVSSDLNPPISTIEQTTVSTLVPVELCTPGFTDLLMALLRVF